MRGRHVSGCHTSLLAVMFVVAAVSGGCNLNDPATEVMLVVEAETQAKMRGVELQVDIEGRRADGQPDGMPITRAFHPKEPGAATWPIELAITPRGGDALRTYSVTATLFDNTGPIAVQRVRSGFVAKKTLALHVVLTDDCLDASLDCGDAETCLLGSCVDAFIDPNELLSWPDGTGADLAADGGMGDTSSSIEPAMMSSTMTGGKGGGKPSGSAGNGAPAKPGGNNMQPGASGAGGTGSMGQPDGAAPQTDKPGDCGDGVINPGEKCDTGIAEGQTGSCPTACQAEDACHPATLEGDGCQSHCTAYAIMTADSGDGCCPPGTNAKDDTDCGALCGNGVQEAGEKCDPVEQCPTLDKCQKADVCLRATIVGDAAQCNAECVMEPIAECVSGDGCCPESCTHASDTDCSTSCGDGVVDRAAGELCEPSSATEPCPTACTDADACTRDVLLGSEKNCNRVCTHVPIVVPIPGDGCCPSGSNANSDLDCKAMCGNGIVELGERCDGKCPKAADCDDGDPCTRDSVEGSACDVHCVHTRINTAVGGDKCCPRGANANNDSDCRPDCGNGVREAGEVCDGADCPKCDDGMACTRDERGGTNCNPTCMNVPITELNPNDGCCVTGENTSTDPSCTNGPPPTGPVCNDNKVEGDEDCDPSVAGSCAKHCDDNVDCTDDVFTPGKDACHGSCSHPKKTTPECMPPEPTCPNGKLDKGETCDPLDTAHPCPTSCDDGKNCTSDELSGSAQTCDAKCTHTALPDCCPTGEEEWQNSSCPARCGNGHVETGEKCDGQCTACTTTVACMRAVTGGTECNPTCTTEPMENCCPPGQEQWEDRDCPARCGNGHVERGEECDETSATCLSCKTVTAPPPPPPDEPIAGSAAAAR